MAVNLAPAETSTSRIVAAIRSLTQQLNSGATLANPTATVGLTAINGSALTGIRSDGAPALSQAIVPTWTALHTFSAGLTSNGPLTSNGSSTLAGFTSSAASAVNAAFTAFSLNGVGYIAPGLNGVIGNGVADDTAAIQAILNAYTDVRLAAGSYLISSTLTINMNNAHYRVVGEGAYFSNFIAKSSFTGTAAFRVYGPTGIVLDYRIGGFSIINQTAGSGATYGFDLGANNASFMGGNTKSEIFDVVCSGFAFNFLCQGVRQVVFKRCAAWNTDNSNTSTTSEFGWYVFANGTSSFAGDMDFDACQVVSSSTGTGVALTDQGTGGSVRGIRFRNHTQYFGAIGLSLGNSGSGSTIGDIWVNPGCQFEGQGSGTMIDLQPSAAGTVISDVHVQGVYGSGSGWNHHFLANATNGGALHFIWILDNFLANPLASGSIDIVGTGGDCRGLTICGNQIYSPQSMGSSGIGIYLETTIQSTVNNNSFVGTGSAALWVVQFTGSGSLAMVAIGNNGGALCSNSPCVDNATGQTAIVANNY